jgi:hypothetical protein
MDKKFNLDDNFEQLSVTTKNAAEFKKTLNSTTSIIDTTLQKKNSGVDDVSSIPTGGAIKIDGKYPERNYIVFNVDSLSSITPYSSNIYTPLSNRL